LTGKGSFQPDEGPMIRFQAGDTLFFPPQTNGVWSFEDAVRKVYVVV